MRLLGIDYGSKNVGIAISDEEGKIAFPNDVFTNTDHLIEEISDFCSYNRIGAVVIGESKNYQGNPNVVMKEIVQFKQGLESKLKIPVYLEPEFLTSFQAKRTAIYNEMADASSAAIILQSYIDGLKHNRKTNS